MKEDMDEKQREAQLQWKEKEANKSYIEQVRLLIIGMEQRLQDREERLLKNIERAEAEGKRFEDAKKHIISGA